MKDPKKDLKEMKEKLTPVQYGVACEGGTEPAFNNEYWDNKREGIYVDILTGKPLFASTDKFESGTGWPSFTQSVDPGEIVEKKDKSLGMIRTEVRSRSGDTHLGHVFDDGPHPTGLRYCVNSASLRFVPVEEMEKAGYGKWLRLFGKEPAPAATPGPGDLLGTGNVLSPGTPPGPVKPPVLAIATFAAGCFWGVEAYFKLVKGVTDTIVGYAGGHTKNPSYEEVCTGTTGHAETVRVTFDPKTVSYRKLLEHFWKMHDPTSVNRQGNDVGSQYRSIIFYHDEAQKRAAEKSKNELEQSRMYKKKIVTEIIPAKEFYPAEEYHQDYLRKNPGGYCPVDLSLAKE
jgi:peptide methionine sulfoxide reductase msrA/msrB